MSLVDNLFKELSEIKEVEAIALGGSRATGKYDESSDYDVYIYLTDKVDISVRKSILEKYCKYMEISNRYWEEEDDVTLNDGVDMDIIYRNLDDFNATLKYVVKEHNQYNSYTTCMWHNLVTSKIIFDRNGRLTALVKEYDIEYPEALRSNIINNGIKLLTNHLPSFDKQIFKAETRRDLVSVNHRLAEFLATYFDVLYAINKVKHPGEKRMKEYAIEKCKVLPAKFNEHFEALFSNVFNNSIKDIVKEMVEEILKIAK